MRLQNSWQHRLRPCTRLLLGSDLGFLSLLLHRAARSLQLALPRLSLSKIPWQTSEKFSCSVQQFFSLEKLPQQSWSGITPCFPCSSSWPREASQRSISLRWEAGERSRHGANLTLQINHPPALAAIRGCEKATVVACCLSHQDQEMPPVVSQNQLNLTLSGFCHSMPQAVWQTVPTQPNLLL